MKNKFKWYAILWFLIIFCEIGYFSYTFYKQEHPKHYLAIINYMNNKLQFKHLPIMYTCAYDSTLNVEKIRKDFVISYNCAFQVKVDSVHQITDKNVISQFNGQLDCQDINNVHTIEYEFIDKDTGNFYTTGESMTWYDPKTNTVYNEEQKIVYWKPIYKHSEIK